MEGYGENYYYSNGAPSDNFSMSTYDVFICIKDQKYTEVAIRIQFWLNFRDDKGEECCEVL